MRTIIECRYCGGRVVGDGAAWFHVSDEPTDHPAVIARERKK